MFLKLIKRQGLALVAGALSEALTAVATHGQAVAPGAPAADGPALGELGTTGP